MAGLWRRFGARLFAPIIRAKFSETPPRPIDQVILEMSGLSGNTVNRATALSVPAIRRGRNQLCAIATLPIIQLNTSNVPQRNPLFEQIDPDIANVVVLAQTIEDLMFDGIAWWEVIETDSSPQHYPISARRREPHTVSLTPPNRFTPAPLPGGYDPRGASVWIDGREVPAGSVIRFDSPNPGILTGGGAKAIRRWLLLDAAASMYASEPRPLDYFSPADGADEIDDDEVQKIIAEWRAARRKRATAWVPKSLKYNTVDSPTPQQMQLAELQKQAVLDMANLLGLDPEELGVSTTSRTYQNDVDRRRNKINDVLSPYMLAVTQRLSMGDVTRRGHRVLLDLRDYLKSNPTEQADVHGKYKAMGVLLPEEIRDDIGRPPLPKQPTPPAAPDVVAEAERIAREAAQTGEPAPPPEDTMTNSRTTLRFNTATATAPALTGVQRIDFDAISVNFRVEKETRTIWGLAIPYNQVVQKWGIKFRFMPGSIEWSTPVSRVKFLVEHTDAVGYALDLTQTRAGVNGKYKLGRSKAADDALMNAEDGVQDGLSAGVEFDLDADALWNNNDGVWDVYRARMAETSLTAMPAFDDARITRVAAHQSGRNSSMEDCAVCGTRHAPGVACASRPQATPPANAPASSPPAPPGLQLNDDQLRALVQNPAALAALVGAPAAAAGAQQPHAFTLTGEQVSALAAGGHLRSLLGGLMGAPAPAQPAASEPAEPRPVVNPAAHPVAVTATREALPYRFNREGVLTSGPQYDFSTDLINGLGPTGQGGDGEALRRAESFVRAMFADTKVADVATLNPNRQRPDLFVDQKEFAYPIWDSINKGTIADATPFVLPKFSSSSGLVGAHTEAVEPTSGNYTATSQTITPSAVSGKASISREAWDQGGNPQLSGLVWTQMVRGWFEALEASAVTLLNGLSVTDLLLTTAAVDAALSSELELKLAALQFVRGGFRMRDFFLQVDLYSALIDATDSDGRKLYPILGATNSTGTTSEFFGDINIAGLRGKPAWALAASGSVAAKSYLFDRGDVSGWATAPNRLTFENVEVRYVHLGIWGYKALACTDTTGVRTVTYDPVA